MGFAIALYAALTSASAAHVLGCGQVVQPPRAIAVWLNVAYGYWWAGTLVLAQVGIGRSLLRLPGLRGCRPTGVLSALMSFTIGSYASYVVLLTVASVGARGGPGFAAYALAAVGLGAPGLRGCWNDLRGGGRSLGSVPVGSPLRSRLVAIGGALALLWLGPYVVQTFLPNSNWDGAMYHLPLARRFVEQGVWATDPYFHHHNFPGAVHLFYGLFLSAGAESAIIPFSFLLALATVAAVYDYCGRYWGREAASWSVLFCLATNLIWGVAVSPRVDVSLALYFLMACYGLSLWDEDGRQAGHLIVVGMALGMMLGIKYTAVAYVAITLAAFLALAWRNRKDPGRWMLAPSIWLAVAVALPSSFWYARNGRGLGDPMYPMVKRQYMYLDDDGRLRDFQRDLALSWDRAPIDLDDEAGGGPDGAAFASLARTVAAPVVPTNQLDLWNVIIHPDKYSRNKNDNISPFLMLFFLLPLAGRDTNSLLIYGIGLASFAAVAAMSGISRYIIPSLPLFAIGAAAVLQRSLDWLAARSRTAADGGLILAFGAAAFGMCHNAIREWSDLGRMAPEPFLAGEERPIDYLARVGYNGVKGAPIASRLINEALDPSDRGKATVLMLGETIGYPLDCRYLPDHNTYEGHRWLAEVLKAGGDHDRLAERLKRQQVRYLIVDVRHLRATIAGRRLSPARIEQIRVAARHAALFLKDHATLLYEDDQAGYYVAEIN